MAYCGRLRVALYTPKGGNWHQFPSIIGWGCWGKGERSLLGGGGRSCWPYLRLSGFHPPKKAPEKRDANISSKKSSDEHCNGEAWVIWIGYQQFLLQIISHTSIISTHQNVYSLMGKKISQKISVNKLTNQWTDNLYARNIQLHIFNQLLRFIFKN